MSKPNKTSYERDALKAWGDDAPEWIVALARHADRIGQVPTARALQLSPSVIAETLRRTYRASYDNVRERVLGKFMGKTVDCLVLGELARDRCLDLQGRPFAATNPERVQLFRTCPTCPHYRGQRKAAPSSQSQPEENE